MQGFNTVKRFVKLKNTFIIKFYEVYKYNKSLK